MLSKNIAIDLGTVNSLVYVTGRGVVLKEPTVVAVSDDVADKLEAVFHFPSSKIRTIVNGIDTYLGDISVSNILTSLRTTNPLASINDARVIHQGFLDSLNTFGNRGYVNTEYIERLITLHRDQHASYFGVMIWVIMMLEQWLTRHTDQFTDWRPPTSP